MTGGAGEAAAEPKRKTVGCIGWWRPPTQSRLTRSPGGLPLKRTETFGRGLWGSLPRRALVGEASAEAAAGVSFIITLSNCKDACGFSKRERERERGDDDDGKQKGR